MLFCMKTSVQCAHIARLTFVHIALQKGHCLLRASVCLYKKTAASLRQSLNLICALYVFLAVLLYHSHLHYKEECKSKDSTDRKNDVCLLNEARNNVHYERDSRNGDCIRKLSRNVVEVVALTACRGHDCRIGNR